MLDTTCIDQALYRKPLQPGVLTNSNEVFAGSTPRSTALEDRTSKGWHLATTRVLRKIENRWAPSRSTLEPHSVTHSSHQFSRFPSLCRGAFSTESVSGLAQENP